MYSRVALILVTVVASMFLFFTFGDRSNAIAGQEIVCSCIADTMFSGHSSEHNTNCGSRANLRVKGWQGIVVFKFDMSQLKGSKVEDSSLKVYCAGITGTAKSPLSLIDLKTSTIAHDWIEGDGDYTPTDKASTYDYPGGDLGMKWAEKDFDGNSRNGIQITVEDVINGVGTSILSPQIDEAIFKIGEWTEIPLGTEPVQALIDGKQYGIVVWQPDIGINLDLASKEEGAGNHAATLIVRAKGAAVDHNAKLTSTWGQIKKMQRQP